MIAALGMYDRPETSAANDALWTAIRNELGFGPETLTRDQDFWDIWRSPELLFSQTCGLPFRAKLHDKVGLVGTPIYDIPDCPDGHYYSVIIAHRSNAGAALSEFDGATFAYNEALSQSGWAAPIKHLTETSVTPGDLYVSGAHVQSAKAVAEGRADFAGLDVVTWQLIQRHDDFAQELTAIARTEPTPVLPFITALAQDAGALFEAAKSAVAGLPSATKETLFLKGITKISASAYLAQPLPPTPESF